MMMQIASCYDAFMKAITLRNIPSDVSRHIEEKSEELGLSLNKTVLRLLQELLRPEDSGPLGTREHHDLDDLAGVWSEEEAEEFERSLREQRRIEPELWD